MKSQVNLWYKANMSTANWVMTNFPVDCNHCNMINSTDLTMQKKQQQFPIEWVKFPALIKMLAVWCIYWQQTPREWGKCPPMHKGVMNSMESACPARLSAPWTLAGTRLDEALMAAEGLCSNRQGRQPSVTAESCLVIEGISLSQQNFRG